MATAQPHLGVPSGYGLVRELPGGILVAEGAGGGGAGFQVMVRGVVATAAALPAAGEEAGEIWITADDRHGHAWDGSQWVDIGEIQGPPGQDGQDGQDGAPGAAATVSVGTTATGTAGSNASVTQAGTPQARILNFTIPRGAQGDPGDPASVAIGTVDTVDHDQPATVTPGTGSTAQDLILDFAIPRGAPGAGLTAAVNTDAVRPAAPPNGTLYFNQATFRVQIYLNGWTDLRNV
jgi:hypothetical protein